MDKAEIKVRRLLAERIGDLAEVMIMNEPPFENLPLYTQVVSYFYSKYLQYKDELSETLKNRILSEEIDYAKHLINMSFGVKKGPAFNKKYPLHAKTLEEFEKWIGRKEAHKNNYLDIDEPDGVINFNVNQQIKSIMEELKPGFSATKHFDAPGVLAFSKYYNTDNAIIILFDIGSGRDFFSVMIGFKRPEAYFDVANLFACEQSVFEFNSREELTSEIDLAVKYIDMIIPTIEQIAKEILQ